MTFKIDGTLASNGADCVSCFGRKFSHSHKFVVTRPRPNVPATIRRAGQFAVDQPLVLWCFMCTVCSWMLYLYIFRATDMFNCFYYQLIAHEVANIHLYHYKAQLQICLACLEPSPRTVFNTKEHLFWNNMSAVHNKYVKY